VCLRDQGQGELAHGKNAGTTKRSKNTKEMLK
jgi:hypothetical protein